MAGERVVGLGLFEALHAQCESYGTTLRDKQHELHLTELELEQNPELEFGQTRTDTALNAVAEGDMAPCARCETVPGRRV